MEDNFHVGVKALILNAEGQILLLQVNPKELIDEDRKYWDIPGGRIKQGATAEETLQAEVMEETGLRLTAWEMLDIAVSNLRIPLKSGGDVGLVLMVYKCQIEPGEPKLSDEHIGYGWFTPADAAEKLSVKYPDSFTAKIANL